MSRLDVEELTRAVLAALLILAVFAAPLYQTAQQPPQPTPTESMRLIIVPARPIHLNMQESLRVIVIDHEDRINHSRNDAVEVRLNEKSNASLGLKTPVGMFWGKSLVTRLNNGSADLLFLGRVPEFAVVSARCVEEDPPTLSCITSLAVGLEEG
ncbi:MAG: hypothetical protein QXK96_02660 [Candidatus Bathyarchaeia archaeon]